MPRVERFFAGTDVKDWTGGSIGGGGGCDLDDLVATGGTTNPYTDYLSHKFTSSGNFTVTEGSGVVEILLVGGGGGAGRSWSAYDGGAGGGGAGGFVVTTATVSSTGGPAGDGVYPIVIGAAGAGGVYPYVGGSTIGLGATAYGGGGCGPGIYQGVDGASGGGGSGTAHPVWRPPGGQGVDSPIYIYPYNKGGAGMRADPYSNVPGDTGQGFDGGFGGWLAPPLGHPSEQSGGGGGGAGGYGQSALNLPTPSFPGLYITPGPTAGNVGAIGGPGKANVYETGSPQTYAGGGGGSRSDGGPFGAGGAGGGGAAGIYNTDPWGGPPTIAPGPFPSGTAPPVGAGGPGGWGGLNGAANTGGGGGGGAVHAPASGGDAYGGSGGSGIVIIRYPA